MRKKKQISVHVELPPNLPQAFADEAKVQEVLLNLLLNACDATPPGGDIWVQARLQGNEVHITVADSGPGVPQELKQKIFLPFFTTKGEKGTGLGLAVSRTAMREMGGDLQLVEAQKGACFLLCLPRVAP
ncbi:MAG: sensor histidine kinase [Thermoanaerobaculaceae bacterium]